MSNLLEKIVINKRNVIIFLVVFIIILGLIFFISDKIIKHKEKNFDVSNAIHGIIIESDVVFYKKPKESKWKDIRKLSLGEKAYIIEDFTDKNGKEWYKVKIGDRLGYVLKSKVDSFEFSKESGNVLMSDVSKFNVIYEHFNNSGEYAAFLLNNNMNYAYIRLGGRGYGDEGNFYTDPNYQMFIDACDYLGVPYGFYYIDEAITSEELDEEVKFVKEFIDKNSTDLCVLPIVIDVESHDGVGRADNMWDERADLLSELIKKFKEKNIETLIYSNANYANEYLYTVDANFWIAYYIPDKKVPDYWYTDTDQDAAKNSDLMNKVVAWQFTESGAGNQIELPVDVSLIKNDFFRKYVK